MKALANLSAASPNEAAIEPEMGLVVVGSDANWRKRSWGEVWGGWIDAGGGERGGPGGGVETGVPGCHDESIEEVIGVVVKSGLGEEGRESR
jgi:hypothetical protein